MFRSPCNRFSMVVNPESEISSRAMNPPLHPGGLSRIIPGQCRGRAWRRSHTSQKWYILWWCQHLSSHAKKHHSKTIYTQLHTYIHIYIYIYITANICEPFRLMNYTFNFTVRFEGLLMSSSELLCVVLLASMDDIGMNILSSYF